MVKAMHMVSASKSSLIRAKDKKVRSKRGLGLSHLYGIKKSRSIPPAGIEQGKSQSNLLEAAF